LKGLRTKEGLAKIRIKGAKYDGLNNFPAPGAKNRKKNVGRASEAGHGRT
jgi:hypothetical protein